MVTDSSPSPHEQTTEPAGAQGVGGKSARRQKSDRFWSWVRVVLLLLGVVGFGLPGILLRPHPERPLVASEPSITVLADTQNVTATVEMTLSASSGPAPQYTLGLTLTPTSSTTASVELAVVFGGFPNQVSGTHLTRLPSGELYTIVPLPSGLSAAARGKVFTYTSRHRIGEATNGIQLRVAFPNLMNETPGTQFSSSVCGLGAGIAQSFAPICASTVNQPQWYEPQLQAGTSTLSSDSTGLGNYEFLAGDAPTLLGGNGWIWNGINGVTMLAANVTAQDNQQSNFFYSGIYLGVAASALIACLAEVFRPVWRKDRPAARGFTWEWPPAH